MSKKPVLIMLHQGADLYGSDLVFLQVVEIASSVFHTIVVLDSDGPLVCRLRPAASEVVVNDLGVLRRANLSFGGAFRMIAGVVRARGRLRRLIRDNGAVGVYSNTLVVVAGALAARAQSVPHVWHVHEYPDRPRAVATALACLARGWGDTVICVSRAVADNLRSLCRWGSADILVVHNGFDSEEFDAVKPTAIRDELQIPDDRILLTLVGRINAWKGHRLLLDAARLMRLRESVDVLFVGDVFGSQTHFRDRLEGDIATSGMAQRCHLLGFRVDARGILAASDIAVVPSTVPDSLPTVVLEAMALRLPVVGTRVGGIPAMIEDTVSGFVVEPDPAELAARLDQLAEDAGLRRQMGNAGRIRFDHLFNSERFKHDIESVLRRRFLSESETS